MRALQYRTYGGPEVLEVAEAPEPHAGPGQIRIAVKAASVNAFDWKLRSGMMAGGKPMEGTGLSRPGRVRRGRRGRRGGHRGGGRRRRLRQRQATPRRSSRCWTPGRHKAPRSTGAVAAAAGVAAETSRAGTAAARTCKAGRHPVHRRRGGWRRRSGAPVRGRARRPGHRLGQRRTTRTTCARSAPIPVLYGQGVVDRVRAVPEAAPVDAVLDVGRQDADRGPDQPGARAEPGRLDRQLRRRECGGAGDRRRRRTPSR